LQLINIIIIISISIIMSSHLYAYFVTESARKYFTFYTQDEFMHDENYSYSFQLFLLYTQCQE